MALSWIRRHAAVQGSGGGRVLPTMLPGQTYTVSRTGGVIRASTTPLDVDLAAAQRAVARD